MDLNAIKAKLQQLDQEKQGQSYEDFSDKFWRPKELGTYKVRVVPSMYDKDNPFTELAFHTKIRKYPILALTNLGKQDPVEELRAQLYKSSDKADWSLAGKLSPRVRYVVPVIVRGEEEKGVRLWEISQTVYKAFLQLAADDEIGDFTDVTDGIDITVERSQGAQYIETGIRASRKNSPLSDDATLVQKWLTEQPKPVDCYTHCDYDYVMKQLKSYLSGGVSPVPQTDVKSSDSEPKAEMKLSTGAPVGEAKAKEDAELNDILGAPVKPVVAKAPKSAASKFEDLFGDDEEF